MDSDLQERLDASKDLLEDSLERSRNAMERLSGGNWDGARSAMLANMAVRRLARPAPKMAPPLTGDEKTTTGGGSPFQSDGSPLFSEYLEMLGAPDADKVGAPLGEGDALLVIDMQRDFVPQDPKANPDGGRFGVAEGDHLAPPIAHLIGKFAAAGGTVVATRDYHPIDHVSFTGEGGPFPAHCVQGTNGSKFLPPIAKALAAALEAAGPERVLIAFKAMHEDSDSFGALQYEDGGDGRIMKRGEVAEGALACTMGCTAAPWTGSLLLKQSGLVGDAVGKPGIEEVDVDAPPDVFAALGDGRDRGARNIEEALRPMRRLFVCGLALDFCVLDTCLNANLLGFESVHMILDAARAAHIPGIGSHGSGFLSDPSEVLGKIRKAGVHLVSAQSLVPGVALFAAPPASLAPTFPHAMAPLGLDDARDLVPAIRLGDDGSFELTNAGAVESIARKAGGALLRGQSMLWGKARKEVSKFTATLSRGTPLSMIAKLGLENKGRCGPLAPLPGGWPTHIDGGDTPDSAAYLTFCYPLDGVAALQSKSQFTFLALTTSAALRFAAYGGFVVLDKAKSVVAVQAVGAGDELTFGGPLDWRDEFTAQLRDAGRLVPVTLPALKAAGAEHFCWINPSEQFAAPSGERWVPSCERGAFLYLRAAGLTPVYFPLA